MAGIYPSSNDREFDLLRKTAQNMYNFALSAGATGLTPPAWLDNRFDLLKKIAYYTASIS